MIRATWLKMIVIETKIEQKEEHNSKIAFELPMFLDAYYYIYPILRVRELPYLSFTYNLY